MLSTVFRLALTLTIMTVGVAFTPVMADESHTDSVQATTPAGSVSTSVQTKKDDMGNSSTHAESSKSDASGSSTTKLHSATGPGGSVSAASHESVPRQLGWWNQQCPNRKRNMSQLSVEPHIRPPAPNQNPPLTVPQAPFTHESSVSHP